jgi:hypothetical protein
VWGQVELLRGEMARKQWSIPTLSVSVFARYPRCVGRVEVGGPGAASRDAAVDGRVT